MNFCWIVYSSCHPIASKMFTPLLSADIDCPCELENWVIGRIHKDQPIVPDLKFQYASDPSFDESQGIEPFPITGTNRNSSFRLNVDVHVIFNDVELICHCLAPFKFDFVYDLLLAEYLFRDCCLDIQS